MDPIPAEPEPQWESLSRDDVL